MFDVSLHSLAAVANTLSLSLRTEHMNSFSPCMLSQCTRSRLFGNSDIWDTNSSLLGEDHMCEALHLTQTPTYLGTFPRYKKWCSMLSVHLILMWTALYCKYIKILCITGWPKDTLCDWMRCKGFDKLAIFYELGMRMTWL